MDSSESTSHCYFRYSFKNSSPKPYEEFVSSLTIFRFKIDPLIYFMILCMFLTDWYNNCSLSIFSEFYGNVRNVAAMASYCVNFSSVLLTPSHIV
jgi:hypothetical protein